MKNLLLSIALAIMVTGTSPALADEATAPPNPSASAETAAPPAAAEPGDVPAVPDAAGAPEKAEKPTPTEPAPKDGTAQGGQSAGSEARSDARLAYDAIVKGEAWIAAGALLSIGVLFLRYYRTNPLPLIGRRVPLPGWFTTDRGGVTMVLGLAFLGAVAHALKADVPINLTTLEGAGKVALGAIGGYAGLKKLFFPATPDAT